MLLQLLLLFISYVVTIVAVTCLLLNMLLQLLLVFTKCCYNCCRCLFVQSGTPFTIEPTTGIVRLTNGLDYDVTQSYSLTITARVTI